MAENKTKRPFFLAGNKRKKVITIAGCLFVATVFWFFNALNNDYSAVIKYPVKIKFSSEEYKLNSNSDKFVKLSATGYGWYLLYYSLGIGTTPINISLHQFVDNQYIPDAKLLELAKIQLQNIDIHAVISDTFKVAAHTKSKKQFNATSAKRNNSLPKD